MIRRNYSETSDGQVHLRSAGSGGGAPLVFLHQTASSGAMFEQVMARLSPLPTLALDTPGFGQSFVPERVPRLSYFGDRLLEALSSLGIDEFHLCGHHTGGCIALEMVVTAPARVLSLAIIGPVIASRAERDIYRQTFTVPFAIAANGSYLEKAWKYLAAIGANRTLQLHHRELVDHLLGAATTPKAFSAVWNQDSEALLAAIRCPLLLMCSHDDVLWPIFGNAQRRRPDARIEIVTGMDFQPDNDPDGVSAALRKFLDSIEMRMGDRA